MSLDKLHLHKSIHKLKALLEVGLGGISTLSGKIQQLNLKRDKVQSPAVASFSISSQRTELGISKNFEETNK